MGLGIDDARYDGNVMFCTDLIVNGGVENGQRPERYEVHDDQIHPVDIDGYVVPVVAQFAWVHLVDVLLVAGVHALLDADLPESGDVVENGEHDDDDHVGAGPAVRAQGSGLKRVADSHEPLQGDGQRQVDRHGLRYHGYRIDDRCDQRVHL